VLTGVLLGSYGRDLPGQPTLATLIQRLLAETEHLRVRISSVEPQDVQTNWLALWQDRRLCRHLHLPLQSGSDAVLSRMRRQYDAQYFANLVTRARQAIPDLAVTTDILVGFPGEDDVQFAQTLELAQHLDFAGIHVFRYSPRPGTPAAHMPDQVPEPAKVARSEALRELGRLGAMRFHGCYSGTVQDVLWEQEHDGIWHGTSDNYLHLYTRHAGTLRNRLLPSRLGEPYADGLWATPLTSPGQVGAT
jgi:threonylcarbamoyladenosine tRNA methylthiotransferase MtaB